jgi:hypothetical protein
VAKGLAQMGVGLAVVMETKITDACYTRLAWGYKILASRAASHNQGGIALLWKENHRGFEVESANFDAKPPHLSTRNWRRAILLHGSVYPPH